MKRAGRERRGNLGRKGRKGREEGRYRVKDRWHFVLGVSSHQLSESIFLNLHFCKTDQALHMWGSVAGPASIWNSRKYRYWSLPCLSVLDLQNHFLGDNSTRSIFSSNIWSLVPGPDRAPKSLGIFWWWEYFCSNGVTPESLVSCRIDQSMIVLGIFSPASFAKKREGLEMELMDISCLHEKAQALGRPPHIGRVCPTPPEAEAPAFRTCPELTPCTFYYPVSFMILF